MSAYKRNPYRGAGILFFTTIDGETKILLVQRKRSGVWTLPGGGAEPGDPDLYHTALRECREEIGDFPTPRQPLARVRFPFAFLGFDWTTYLFEVPPGFVSKLPDRSARDFRKEFRDGAWFPLRRLPPKRHVLLHPVLLKLKRSPHS